jgi:hypothetical protein
VDKPTTFTEHAFQRVQERLQMPLAEIAHALDTDQYTPLGIAVRSDRKHLLFYSQFDDECFIAVRDEKTREVITILPTNYDSHCRVSPEAIDHLKRQYEVTGSGHYTPDVTELNRMLRRPEIRTKVDFNITLRHKNYTLKFKKLRMKISKADLPQGIPEISQSLEAKKAIEENMKGAYKNYVFHKATFSYDGKEFHPFSLPITHDP